MLIDDLVDLLRGFAVTAVIGEQAAQRSGAEELDVFAGDNLAPDLSLSIGQLRRRIGALPEGAGNDDRGISG
jgi:hypothetical protein